MSRSIVVVLALTVVGCAAAPHPPTGNGAAAKAPLGSVSRAAAAAAPPAPPRPVSFIEDDLPAAMARARAEGKALFVDTWAPWCHTCLSMKHFVLNDPSLAPLADRVVFAAIDTDRPQSEGFLARYTVRAWPTFFVLDPKDGSVLGYWSGSASVSEIRAFVLEGLASMTGGPAAAGDASRAFADARAAHAAGDLGRAAAAYDRAIAAAAPDWPNRSAAMLGAIQVLHGAKEWNRCVATGLGHLRAIRGAALPADAASYLLSCAEHLPKGAERDRAQAEAVARLDEFTRSPPPDASVDDRSDALDILSNGRSTLGDAAGARRAQEDRLALMEQAARAANTPEEAQTFDYGRANAYVALGRADEAIRMLAQREKEFPNAYEPPGRLADVLAKTGKLEEALAAAERATARAYGPRRLRYLKLRAEIYSKMGNRAGEVAALREEVAGWEALPAGQASPEKLAEARRRLDEAVKQKRNR